MYGQFWAAGQPDASSSITRYPNREHLKCRCVDSNLHPQNASSRIVHDIDTPRFGQDRDDGDSLRACA